MYKRTSGVSDGSGLLLLVRGHHFFNLSYRFSWVQALRGRRARKSSENYFEIFKRMERRKPSCQGQYIIHSTRCGAHMAAEVCGQVTLGQVLVQFMIVWQR